MLVVVLFKPAQDVGRVSLVVNQDAVEELATGCADEALSERVGTWCPHRRPDDGHYTGLITLLDRWVLHTAVAQLATWRSTTLGRAEFALHVNISPVELRTPRFVDDVVLCLTRHGVGASDLMLEVTETQLMGEDAQTLQALEALQAAGIGVAIDDFGTGYSSVGYLRRMFLDVVKIDRPLITGLDTDPQQHRVAAAILAILDAFGLTAVAEGVETAEQATQLRVLGCRYGQGFHWGRPVPADAMTALLGAAPSEP